MMIDLKNIYVHGRFHLDQKLYLYNTASGIEFNAFSKVIKVVMNVIPGQVNEAWVRIIIDNNYDNGLDIHLAEKEKEYVICAFDHNEEHNIKLLKVSEAIESHIVISDISLDGNYLKKPQYENELLVFGDSTASAYGNLGKATDVKQLYDTDGLNGFCFLCAKAYNIPMVGLTASGWGAAFSPWTTPQRISLVSYYDKVAPFSDISFDMKQVSPKAVIISLGTNDSYYIINGETGKTKEDLTKEFMNYYHKLLTLIKRDFHDVPIIMVYGAMRERHNYEVMHKIYLDNVDSFNLYEVVLDGDGKGVSGHPSIESDKKMSKELIKKIGEVSK